MMIPTQLKSWSWQSPSSPGATPAGLMWLALPHVHLCSMGLGAGILAASSSLNRSSMYCRSAPFGSLHKQLLRTVE